MKKVLRIASLFTGCGGLDLGFEKAEHPEFQFKVVWSNDNFSPAVETFKKNFGDLTDSRDVWKIDFKKVPDCDVVLAGFPCQDFSVLSKRRGLNVKRGQLYTRVVDMIATKKPLVFVAENVKGLISANKGKAFEIIKSEFENPDGVEYDVKFKVINFADYGVPQTRERTIIVGFRKDVGIEYEFPQPTHKTKYVTVKEALKGVEQVSFNNEFHRINPRTIEILSAIPPGGNYQDLPPNLRIKGLMSNIYRRLHPDKPAYTVIANGGGGTWGYHYKEPRPLTNRERARLQSFPDSFEFVGKVGEIRTLIGNAVPPLGAKAIAESILKSLSGVGQRKIKAFL